MNTDSLDDISALTLGHYDRNAEAFFEGTRNHDVILEGGEAAFGCETGARRRPASRVGPGSPNAGRVLEREPARPVTRRTVT
jgi:hypothetical protein